MIISAGNHDYFYEKSLYNRVEWSPNVFIFRGNGLEKIEFPDLNTIIYGYSWDRVEIREITYSMILILKKIMILIKSFLYMEILELSQIIFP